MATYLTAPRVQQWLEKTSLTVTDIDVMRESMARDVIFGAVRSRYDASTWLDADTTPSLVLNLMGALYASYTYNAQYSENYGESDYGRQLWSLVNKLLIDIQTGEVDLAAPAILASFTNVGFYPTDTQETDGLGEERKFSMGSVF